ncbi:MAG: GNAT family N-acetyltransferase [Acidobacteria bacterium]|nr:GNAT family N-acetyltransferase [Acidobacteriota bacterium]
MSKFSPEIRDPTRGDLRAIIELMREFAEYESLVDYLEVTEERLSEVMFGTDSFVKGLLAFNGETPIAYALFYHSFSSFRGQKSVYLEDIFITKEYRRSGIGRQLLREVAKAGKETGAERMDFQVLKWNTPAIDFYKKHGASIDSEERHVKFTDNAFQKLAGNTD